MLTPADVAYVRANFVPLETCCVGRPHAVEEVRRLIDERLLPRPSYVLPDGTEMVPADYFHLADDAGAVDRLRPHFDARFLAAGGQPDVLEEEWNHYLSGVYGVCLRRVTPETIVRKGELMDSIEGLLAEPRADDEDWRWRLRQEVDELDALERQFSPDYDRSDAFEQPPSRDRLVGAARARYPDVFRA
jgi:Family of unknown function (DUF6058)